MRKSASLFLMLLVFTFCFTTACSHPRPVEISFGEKTPEALAGQVYIEGEVNVPGIYPLRQQDTLGALLESAGGLQVDGDDVYCRVCFYSSPMTENEQKVDLNRAPEWLLEVLPGIGKVTAQNIVAYRTHNGPFRHIKELMNVAGIGEGTFANLAGKITVFDAGG